MLTTVTPNTTIGIPAISAWGAAVIAGIVDDMKVTCQRAAAARAISSPVAAA
jgi:hypothetical protein